MFNTQIKDAGSEPQAPEPKNRKKPSFGKAKGVPAPKKKKATKPGGMGIGLPSLPGMMPQAPPQPMM
jgi:hypothetical protein